MLGSAGAIVTNGLGAFVGDENHLVTLGYGNQAAAVVIPAPVVLNLGAGGKVLSWEEALLEAVKKRELERELQNKAVELKQVVKKIQKTEAKVKKAKPQQVDGILANLWKLEERKEELKLQVQTFQQRIEDIEILLLAANKAKQEEEEDEQEIELLLLQ